MSISMHDSNKIMISIDPDIYKFRMLEKKDGIWQERFGPIIDRKVD